MLLDCESVARSVFSTEAPVSVRKETEASERNGDKKDQNRRDTNKVEIGEVKENDMKSIEIF